MLTIPAAATLDFVETAGGATLGGGKALFPGRNDLGRAFPHGAAANRQGCRNAFNSLASCVKNALIFSSRYEQRLQGRGETVGDDERKHAEALYQRLLDVFPKRQNDNVVIFPGPKSHQREKTPQSAALPLEGSPPRRAESQAAVRPGRIEGLLKRLFEDLAKDD